MHTHAYHFVRIPHTVACLARWTPHTPQPTNQPTNLWRIGFGGASSSSLSDASAAKQLPLPRPCIFAATRRGFAGASFAFCAEPALPLPNRSSKSRSALSRGGNGRCSLAQSPSAAVTGQVNEASASAKGCAGLAALALQWHSERRQEGRGGVGAAAGKRKDGRARRRERTQQCHSATYPPRRASLRL